MDKIKLFEWQKDVIKKLFKIGGYALNSKTGAGKGILGVFAIGYALHQSKTVLLVCPIHLTSDWIKKIDEIIPKYNDNINVITKDNKDIIKDKINIISYNKLGRYSKDLIKNKNLFNGLVILDESHHVKNVKSKSYKSILKIINKYNTINLLLSATMKTKSNLDLFAPVHLTNNNFRNEYPTFWNLTKTSNLIFDEKYVAGGDLRRIPIDFTETFFNDKINPCIYRPQFDMKDNVIFKDVYIKTNSILEKEFTRLDDGNIDEEKLNQMSAYQVQSYLNEIMNPHSKFLQLANNFIYKTDKDGNNIPKYFNYKYKLDMLNSVIENETLQNHKGLLYYFFQSEKDKLKENFKDNKNVYWFNSKKDVWKQIDEFESGNYTIFIANNKSLGEGVRFKLSHYIIMYSSIFDYGAIIQSHGRLGFNGRIDNYTIYNFRSDSKNVGYIEDVVQQKIKEANEFLNDNNK